MSADNLLKKVSGQQQKHNQLPTCKELNMAQTEALIFTDEGERSSIPASPSVDACLTMAACGGIQQLSVTDQNSAGESERVSYYKNLS